MACCGAACRLVCRLVCQVVLVGVSSRVFMCSKRSRSLCSGSWRNGFGQLPKRFSAIGANVSGYWRSSETNANHTITYII